MGSKKYWVMSVIVIVLVTSYVGYRKVLSSRIETRLDVVREAGYPVTLRELNDWYSYPSGPNAALVYEKAFAKLNYDPSVDQDIPLINYANVPERGGRMPDKMREGVGGFLKRNAEVLALLHEAAGIADCRYPIDLADLANVDWSTRGPAFRNSTDLLALQALISAENHDRDQTVESIIAILALGRSLRKEPSMIALLELNRCNLVARATLEDVLNKVALDEDQLKQLAEAFAVAEDPESVTRVLVGMRCCDIVFLEDPLQSWGVRFDYEPSRGSSGLVLALQSTGHLQGELADYLGIMAECVRASQFSTLKQHEFANDLRGRIENLSGYGSSTNSFLKILLAAIPNIIDQDLEDRAGIRIAVISLAIERYQLAHLAFPTRLDELVPTYVSQVPEDPFDGKPLRYRQTDKGYIVYSIGVDGIDNKGESKRLPKDRYWLPMDDAGFIVERER